MPGLSVLAVRQSSDDSRREVPALRRQLSKIAHVFICAKRSTCWRAARRHNTRYLSNIAQYRSLLRAILT